MTLVLVTQAYACGGLVFGKSYSTFCFGTGQPWSAVSSPSFEAAILWLFSLQTSLLCMVEGDMGHRTMAVKCCRERRLGSLHTPCFLQVCLISHLHPSVVSFAHSPLSGTPLQPPLQMTITMFMRDMVLKAVPKKSMCSATHTVSFKLMRPVPDEILNWTGSCEKVRDTKNAVRGQYSLLSPWPARWPPLGGKFHIRVRRASVGQARNCPFLYLS